MNKVFGKKMISENKVNIDRGKDNQESISKIVINLRG